MRWTIALAAIIFSLASASDAEEPSATSGHVNYEALVVDRIAHNRMAVAATFEYRKQNGMDPFPQDVASLTKDYQREYEKNGKVSAIAFCKDSISMLSLKKRDRLLSSSLESIKQNDLKSAKEYVKNVNEIEKMDDELGTLVCRPEQ